MVKFAQILLILSVIVISIGGLCGWKLYTGSDHSYGAGFIYLVCLYSIAGGILQFIGCSWFLLGIPGGIVIFKISLFIVIIMTLPPIFFIISSL